MLKNVELTESQIKVLSEALEAHQQELSNEIQQKLDEVKALQEKYTENENLLEKLGSKSTNGYTVQQPQLSNVYVHPKEKNESLSLPVDLTKEYRKSWNYWQKAQYVLGMAGGGLTGKEVVNRIFEAEPELQMAAEHEQEKALNNIYATLTIKHKKQFLKRYKRDDNQYVYEIEGAKM